jgi:hypothetical protein
MAGEPHLVTELQKAAEKEAKRARKAPAAASFVINAVGQRDVRIECVWLAREGDVYRYQRKSDGEYVTTDAKDVLDVRGTVLTAAPLIERDTVKLSCQGGQCKDYPKTQWVSAWPAESNR